MSETKNFKSLFEEVKILYPEISDLSELEIENIQTQADRRKLVNDTNLYLISVIIAIFFFLIFPFFIAKLYFSLDIITDYLVNNKGTYSKELINTFNFSFGIGAFAIVCYFFLLPFITSSKNDLPFGSVNTKQSNFRFFTIIGTYIVIGLAAFLLYLNSDYASVFIAENFKYYLLVPLFIIAMFLTFILLFSVIGIPFIGIFARRKKQNNNKRIEICIKLLITLKKISSFDNFCFLPPSDNKVITSNLYSICSLIKSYPKGISEFIDNNEIETDFLKAGQEFEKNIINFISTNELHSETIKSTLISYLNTFLSGDLSTLPKSENIVKKNNGQKTKIIHYFLFGLYLILPIIIIFILKLAFKINFDEYMQSLMKILYVIWACVGIFSNPFVLNAESKDLLKDIIKTLIGKG